MSRTHTLDYYRNKLHALRSRLDHRVDSLREEALHGAGGESSGDLSNAPIHMADRGNAESEAVVNLRLAENEATLRQQVEEALWRVEAGTFGVCEECQCVIDAHRLDAIPYSRLCIQCANR
jgi:DnaK suppressor protein